MSALLTVLQAVLQGVPPFHSPTGPSDEARLPNFISESMVTNTPGSSPHTFVHTRLRTWLLSCCEAQHTWPVPW